LADVAAVEAGSKFFRLPAYRLAHFGLQHDRHAVREVESPEAEGAAAIQAANRSRSADKMPPITQGFPPSIVMPLALRSTGAARPRPARLRNFACRSPYETCNEYQNGSHTPA
jgi:hypothetical protein